MTISTKWLAAAVAALVVLPAWGQDGPQPKQKDYNAKFQPKQATFTTAVEPAEAKPGDTVKLVIKAKLDPKWHIYKYTKEQPEVGPRQTEFDLFATGGLEVAGEWEPDEAPHKEKDPAFPELEFVEFHSDEVTWSVPLRVPDGTAPGEVVLKVQAYYQLCEKSCTRPGRWTLPEAKLTVGEGKATDNPKPTPVSDKAPKVKDDDPGLQPKAVQFATAFEPAQAKPGATVQLRVTAKMQPGWNVYDLGPEGSEGPHTELDLFDSAGLALAGGWKPSRPPTVKTDPERFPFALTVSSFADEVIWSIPLTVPADAAPGSRAARVQAFYQTCDDRICSRAGRWTLPVAMLMIQSPDAPTGPVIAADATPPPDPSRLTTGPPEEVDSVAATATRPVTSNNVEKSIEEGFLSFLLLSALGGLFALAMPCVWPMVPVTVNFFVKQGQARNGRVWPLATIYCGAIIGIFTLFGVFCAFLFDASSLKNLANNPWLNFTVAGLFLIFGLSLLGLFEIQLPSFLLNASAKGESHGGYVGIIFMALTLTITSFTCTLPVVGGLVLLASRGEFFYPIIGMMVFAAVLAAPFFLLALSPGLLSKVPRSGDWMNAIKVVGGLIEIGAAFKFLNSAELAFVAPENAWTDAHMLLSIWVILSAVAGIYLLGLFRTDHDQTEAKVGPGRILFGSLFLTVAIYVAPALFGAAPKSRAYEFFVLGLLPPGGDIEQLATSSDPKEAQRQQTSKHGVVWGMSYEKALEEARAAKRPVLIDFTGVNCPNCRLMEKRVMPKPEVVSLLEKFQPVQLHTDFVPIASISAEARKALADENFERQVDIGQDATNPFYVIVDPQSERVLGTIGGYTGVPAFVEFLEAGLDEHVKAVAQVAQDATSSDPKEAQRQQTSKHGVVWGMSYEKALEEARAAERPALIAFTSVNTPNSRIMERRVLPKPEVVAQLERFQPVQLHTDFVPIASIPAESRKSLADENFARQINIGRDFTTPYYVVIDPRTEDVLDDIGGYVQAPEFAEFLAEGLKQYHNAGGQAMRSK